MHAPEVQTEQQQPDDLLWRHLKTLPAFRALLRAVEARYMRHLDIPGPILDLGCGDGHFAGMAFDQALAAGVDPWWGPLTKARRAGIYHLSVQAQGHALPFDDGSFASVISNSVLEHIPDVQPVLHEAARVLRPGGRLVLTTPSHLFSEQLGGAALLRPLGLDDAYRRFFNRISRHAHTDPPEVWAERLARAGFAVERWQYYFSIEALRALELGHLHGAPSALLNFLTGQWIVAPWRENLRFTEQWLRPYYDEQAPAGGAYLLFVARKAGPPLAADGSIEMRLPAPRPLPVSEPAAISWQEPGPDGDVAVEPTPDDAGEPEPIAFRVSDTPRRERQAAAQVASPAWRGVLALLLLLSGLLAALLGQNILAQRLPSAAPGVAWYAAGLAALAAAGWVLRRDSVRGAFAFSRRALLYPLALMLALLAQRQSGASLFDGSALLALLLWLGAIALGLFALWRPETGGPARTAEPVPAQDRQEGSERRTTIFEQLPYGSLYVLLALFLGALLPRLLWLAEHPYIINGIEASIGLDALAVLQGQIRNPFATAWLSNPTMPLYPAALMLALLGRSVVGLRLLPALVGALSAPLLFLVARRLWGGWFGLTAALFLAGWHLHVHYSRLAMTNIWEPLAALFMFGAIVLALENGGRRLWLLAGVATGASAYFYLASHLAPIFLLLLLLYLLIVRRDLLVAHGANLAAAAAMALLVALPQIVYYQAHPGVFMERVNLLGIFHSNWLAQQVGAGNVAVNVLLMQLRRASLAFTASLDASTSYNPGIPLLRTLPAIFFTVGVALAIWRVRRPRYALLLLWLLVTLIFGEALLVDAPGSHRVLIAAPFVALLVTSALFWIVGRLRAAYQAQGQRRAAFSRRIPAHIAAALLLVLLFVAGDLIFYFGQYRQSHRFGDRNSEIAHEVGHYLNSLEGDWRVYFHGPPAMYISFPTILYLATDFQSGVNLMDVPENAGAPPEAQPNENLVFIYLPERSAEVNQTAQRYPQGTLLTFEGVLQNPLFYSYEVRP